MPLSPPATADAHFSIGKTHRVCEDYARAGLLPDGRAFAIVSDGCSSSQDTDFGSRLLTVAAQERMIHMGDSYNPEGVVWQALGVARAMRLQHTCLDATLLTLCQKSNGDVVAYLVGDGALVARRRTGEVEVWRMQFLPGDSRQVGPAYLTYTMEKQRLESYIAQNYHRWMLTYSLDGVLQETVTGEVSFEDSSDGTFRPLNFWQRMGFSADDYDYLMVVSDGVESFQVQQSRGVYAPVPFHEVMSYMAAMKSLKGPFVAKRLKRFLEKTAPKLLWHHNDDVAAAGIALPERTET